MVTSVDVNSILAHIDEIGLVPAPVSPGWGHMGAVLSDAALQAGVNYRSTVFPRVKNLVEQWPDATTVSMFSTRISQGDLEVVLDWAHGSKKMRTLRDLTDFLRQRNIETVDDLRASLALTEFRDDLREIKGVGAKTIDYLAILTGSTNHAAIDVHLRRFIQDAGVTVDSYGQALEILRMVAEEKGWSLRALDAAIWQYKSNGA